MVEGAGATEDGYDVDQRQGWPLPCPDMAEGLSAAEVGKEISEHRKHSQSGAHDSAHDRGVTIIEAALLAIVALLAAWSGYASAKWSTESRLDLARASTARVEADRAAGSDAETLEFDVSTFDAWFTAYVAGNEEAMAIAEQPLPVRSSRWHVRHVARPLNPATNPDARPRAPRTCPSTSALTWTRPSGSTPRPTSCT